VKLAIVTLLLVGTANAADIPLSNLTFTNANGQPTTYHGSLALKMTSKDGTHEAIATIPGVTFRDGAIDVDVSGAPAKGAAADARGFIGIIFRQQKNSKPFEIIYIRPTNGRADDQLRRNHTVQYSSDPDWPWERLRRESPGVYESYADMQAGEWTHMRIVVKGRDASLYINHAEQPCLIVHDLKLGETEGGVALWTGSDTEGYFRNLKITN
jgi:Domain of Unknown Function (DUF1080)